MFELQDQVVASALGLGFMLAGFYGLKRARINTTARVILGAFMFAAGVGLLYPLVQGSNFWSHPVRLGLAVALVGLGINQAATPLRLALGKSA